MKLKTMDLYICVQVGTGVKKDSFGKTPLSAYKKAFRAPEGFHWEESVTPTAYKAICHEDGRVFYFRLGDNG